MEKSISILLFLAITFSVADICDVSQRQDCGFVGIDQTKCEQKGCCWRPASVVQHLVQYNSLEGLPWCYYAASDTCSNIKLDAKDPGFDDAFYTKMYDNFLKQIDVEGKGGVMASPDLQTPAGSYYFHWMRDAALVMRSYMEINDNDLTKIQTKMDRYIQWILRVQNEHDPNGIDIRSEPRFNLPNGDVDTKPWGRPQTDGPALRASTVIQYANILLDAGKQDYVKQYLWTTGSYNGGIIKYDLDYLVKNWLTKGCDLWEDNCNNDDFFWNRLAFIYVLKQGAAFANRLGDYQQAAIYQNKIFDIQPTLSNHWTGTFMHQAANRQKDAVVIHAFVSFPGVYPLTGNEVASTLKVLTDFFCQLFKINQQDNVNGIPGLLYGRYEGDVYAGGNPWQLLSASVAELYYSIASQIKKDTNFISLVDQEIFDNWKDILKLQEGATYQDLFQSTISAGDSILQRVYYHVKGDNGNVYEQLDRNTGFQASAKSLTWSYANLLRVLHLRKSLVQV